MAVVVQHGCMRCRTLTGSYILAAASRLLWILLHKYRAAMPTNPMLTLDHAARPFEFGI
jgi:hypothetical protein